jgi:hypothetical protein
VGLPDVVEELGVVVFVVAVVEAIETTATRKSSIRTVLCFEAVNMLVSPTP